MTSDSGLRDNVHAELLRQFSVSAEKIEVQVLDGVVTLTGQVGSDMARWRLDDAIRALTGVQDLIDETITVPEAPRTNPDPDTARPWFPAG